MNGMRLRLLLNRLLTAASVFSGEHRRLAKRRARWYERYSQVLDALQNRHPQGLPPHLFIETQAYGESTTEGYLCRRWARQGLGLSPEQRAPVLRQLLDEVRVYFARHGLEYWLDGGTLLGAYRDGKLIPWDEDADIALREDTLFQLVRVVEQHPFTDPECLLVLRRTPYAWENTIPPADLLPCMLVHTGTGVYVDLFILHETNGHRLKMYWRGPCYACRRGGVTFAKDLIFPLRDIRLEGQSYPAPQQTPHYLRRYYGDLQPRRSIT